MTNLMAMKSVGIARLNASHSKYLSVVPTGEAENRYFDASDILRVLAGEPERLRDWCFKVLGL